MSNFINKCKIVFLSIVIIVFLGNVYGAGKLIADYKSLLPTIDLDVQVPDAQKVADFLVKFCPHDQIEGYDALLEKITSFMAVKKSLNMYLPGFPFKSINRIKCISEQVDLGECLALITLEHMAAEIEKVYPLVGITIVSDGYAYKTMVDPDDTIIAEYHDQLKELIRSFPHLDFQDGLSIGGDSYDVEVLHQEVAREVLGSWTQENQETADDMQIFVKRDCAFLGVSSVQIAQITLEMVQGSMKYGQFLKRYYLEKDFIRLSVHQHADVSKKLGINLIYGHKGTPWHNAVVVSKGEFSLTNHINYNDLSQPVVYDVDLLGGFACLKPATIVMTRGGYEWRPY